MKYIVFSILIGFIIAVAFIAYNSYKNTIPTPEPTASTTEEQITYNKQEYDLWKAEADRQCGKDLGLVATLNLGEPYAITCAALAGHEIKRLQCEKGGPLTDVCYKYPEL